ncbi:MAG TPA: HEAT repeat domain-containing protein [Longimicrobiaceae bacterium]|nr:HEAT repeat domain-containing protein [Longimicrobiaceae bacterium]
MTPRHLAALTGLLAVLAAAGPLPSQAPPARGLLRQAAHAEAVPPAPRWPQDPADGLYRSAREALNRRDYARAAGLFERIGREHPRSRYAADALYWEAFARYRAGGKAQFDRALAALDRQRTEHPRASTRRDADELATRIRGELARRGDERAQRDVERSARRGTAETQQGCGDDDMRVAALNALLQMDAERALPILRGVLARRDACSEELRSKAVFLVSQKRSPETENILLGVARNDPSSEVRQQAVFWLSQVGTERSLQFIEEILRTSPDRELQKKAIFALSQHRSPRASALLREYAERAGAPVEVREDAIFWLGQRRSEENAGYLRSLFGRLDNKELKNKVIFSLSQMRGVGNDRWLIALARNGGEDMEVRKQALFWAGQMGVPFAEISGLYDSVREPELREQLIFVISQRRDPAAVDKLIDIARNDRDSDMREKALFWLSQSRDPRATRVISDIINQ